MILSLHPETPQRRHLDRVAELLDKDGVIAYPTDTLFGLGCLISRKKAVDRIQRIKGRDPKKPMSVLCSNFEMLCRYARPIESPIFKHLKHMFPGPYTAILPASREVPRVLQHQQNVGLRMPDHAFCRDLVNLIGEPILTTSCNLTGQPPLNDAWTIEDEMGHQLDLIVDCGVPEGLASTIIDFTGETPCVLREGAGPWPI